MLAMLFCCAMVLSMALLRFCPAASFCDPLTDWLIRPLLAIEPSSASLLVSVRFTKPEPLFAARGAAHRVGGVLVSELVGGPDGWALTVRQEVHPDSFYPLRTLLVWLGRRARTGTSFAGYLRFHEEAAISPLVVRDGELAVPDAVEEHTPDWR